MKGEIKQWLIRLGAGGALGALFVQATLYFFWGSFLIPAVQGRPVHPFGIPFWLVMPQMAADFGSADAAGLIQLLLSMLFGAVVAVSTLPFAEGGRALVLRSLAHFVGTGTSFALLLGLCRWVDWRMVPVCLFLLALLYLLIWLGRWIGWYSQVVQLRTLLGLSPGPSPLKWKETLPYLPFILLVCMALPLILRGIEQLFGADIPVFTGLLYPYLILPAVGFCSGLSLGKHQGLCWLYPPSCALCYLPTVYLLFNDSALFHCFMIAVPALAGVVMGWLYRRAVPKKAPKS